MRSSGLVVLLVFLAGCGGKPAANKVRPPPLVVAAPVLVKDLPVLFRAPVDVRPIAQADVGSKTVGYLDTVLVDRGDVVKKGQLLATVRPSDLPDQLSAARSAVGQAQAASALAKANLERAQALAPRGLVSQQELQNATSAAATSDAQLSAAQSQLGVFATRLGETKLEAPFEGVVVVRRLDPGAIVGPATGAVLTIARLDTVRVFISVNERQAQAVKVGQTARVRFDAITERVFEGRVERLAPSFDPLTRTLDAEVHLPNPDRALRPGMYGRAELELDRHPGALVMPVEAVQLSEGRAFVWVLEGDVARRREVKVGEELDEQLEILEGLQPGASVVLKGLDGLADGAKVRVPSSRDAGTAP